MAARKKTDHEWTKEKIDALKALADECMRADPEGVVYPEGAWTVLKLLSLYYWHGIYLRLLNDQREKGFIRKLYYIDMNAGAGVVELEGLDTHVAGSAVIGANTYRAYGSKAYDEYIFVEPDPDRAKTLERRLDPFVPADRVSILQGDIDQAMDDIVRRVKDDSAHYLAVVDPYAFRQGSWSGYGRLMEETARGDFLITFQTTAVKRTSEASRRAFLGPHWDESLKDAPEDEILEAYKSVCLRPHRPIADHVHIRAGGTTRYYYDLVYAVAQTRGGNRFMDAFTDLAKRINGLTGRDIANMVSSHDLFSF